MRMHCGPFARALMRDQSELGKFQDAGASARIFLVDFYFSPLYHAPHSGYANTAQICLSFCGSFLAMMLLYPACRTARGEIAFGVAQAAGASGRYFLVGSTSSTFFSMLLLCTTRLTLAMRILHRSA